MRSLGGSLAIPALFSSLLAVGCSRPDDARPGALVLIVIDTLRGDRVGCMGYSPAVTPALDSLAAAGTRFSAALTPAPVTLPAVASLLTGRAPYHHGVRDNRFFKLREEETTLAERFSREGWRTGAVLGSAILARDRGLDQGFDSYDDAFRGPYEIYDPAATPDPEATATTSRRADVVTRGAVAFLDSVGSEPFFLFVHYWDVHHPYDPPPEYARVHRGNRYDGEVSYVDHEIGRLLAKLESRPDAMVVVVSDHGESQMEHGEPQHGFFLYESTLHVLLLASGPGVPSGMVRSEPVSLVDVSPTLVRIFDLPGGGPRPDGESWAWEHAGREDRPLYAETFHTLVSYGWGELRAMRAGSSKVIVGGNRIESYDLKGDPRELRDLGGAAHPDLCDALAEITGKDPVEAVLASERSGEDASRAELLQSLGYIGSPPAGSRETSSRPHPLDAVPRWFNRNWADHHVQEASRLFAAGAWAGVISHLDTALTLDPERADAWYERGRARARVGDRDAEDDIGRALDVDSTYVPALAWFADQALRDGRDPEALAFWRRVAEADPEYAPAQHFLADWLLRQDLPGEALPYLRRLVSSDPKDPTLRFNLGLAASRAGRIEEARQQFETFLQLAPGDPKVAGIEGWLRRHSP